MFARFLEFTVKPDKKTEFVKKMKEEIFPILKAYKGFFDLVPLEVETEFTKFYAISFWHEREDMEKYTREHFPKVKAIVEPFLTAPIVVKHCSGTTCGHTARPEWSKLSKASNTLSRHCRRLKIAKTRQITTRAGVTSLRKPIRSPELTH